MGCYASCAESEFGGRSAKFYRHPTFPAFCSATSLRAPVSLPKFRSLNSFEESSVSLVLDDFLLRLHCNLCLYLCDWTSDCWQSSAGCSGVCASCFVHIGDSREDVGITQHSRALGINSAKFSGPTVQTDRSSRSLGMEDSSRCSQRIRKRLTLPSERASQTRVYPPETYT